MTSPFAFIRTAPERSPRRGFSLVEMAIVLGVIGLILTAIWTSVAEVNADRMVGDEVSDLLTISQNIRSLYVSRGSFAETTSMNDITASLISAGVFPANLRKDTTKGYVYNREGGRLTVNVIPNSPGATNRQFEIQFYSTPKTCKKLLARMSAVDGTARPVYLYDNVNGWTVSNGKVDPSLFVVCNYAAFTFDLITK